MASPKLMMLNQCKDNAGNQENGNHMDLKSQNRNDILTCTPGSSTFGEKSLAYSKDVNAAFGIQQVMDSQAIPVTPKGLYVPRDYVSVEKNTRQEDGYETVGTYSFLAAASYDVDTSIRVSVPYSVVEHPRRTAKRNHVLPDGDPSIHELAREYCDSMLSDDDTVITNIRELEGHETVGTYSFLAAASYDVDTSIRVSVLYSDVESRRRIAKRKREFADGDSGIQKQAREHRESMSSVDDTLTMQDVV